MKRIVLHISQKYSKLYGFLYLFFFFLLLIAGAFLPYVYKGLVYSIGYEKEEACGIIEKEICVEEEVAVKHRTTTVYSYFFKIDDYEVAVRPSDCREYEVGDEFDYYIYFRNGATKADSRNYTWDKGLLGLLAECAVFYVAISYMFADTCERKESSKDNKEKDYEDKDVKKIEDKENIGSSHYDVLSDRELYELCQKRNIKIIEGKRNNREYLERCLRSDDASHSYRSKWHKKNEKRYVTSGRIFIILVVGGIIVVVCHYMKIIYHFIYLFT